MKIFPDIHLLSAEFDRYGPALIHPDDLHAAIEAKIQQGVRDSTRFARNPTTPQQVEEDLFIGWLAFNAPMRDWPEWLRRHVIEYAAWGAEASWDYGRDDRGKFLVKLGKALEKGRSRWFDSVDIFILENNRWCRALRERTRPQAVKILQQEGFSMTETSYASRRKRLGMRRGAKSQKLAPDFSEKHGEPSPHEEETHRKGSRRRNARRKPRSGPRRPIQ